ncbi:NAD-dependent epimerase [Pleurocapsa sp. PCC 7319]|uniref:NAD-dependent epimerase n=1 Tax=Pleurocapsa sp. PCC 7319 TaxID=118161 RepID=UPI000347972B|nr:NAD-dependent epimerase [Pleurocapsa sp. PCC 7319]
MKILITGVAGFIGYHLAKRLLAEGNQVHGIDNLNEYYDLTLKHARLEQLLPHPRFTFDYLDISDRFLVTELFQKHNFDYVIHLAAQAGVRYSLKNPHAYVDSNLVGFTHILEGCRQSQIEHLVFASSSSVYGANTKVPFAVSDNVDHPVSLYAATKKANELMAHAYSHLYQIPMTGLRFFTVYGPWGRPDMAYFKFVRAIAKGERIDVYNFGKMKRDFTYIDDIIEAIVRVLAKTPQSSKNQPPYKIYNVGNNNPVELNEFIAIIERIMGKSAQKNLLPMQPGDVVSTFADIDELIADIDFKPTTTLAQGLENFINWYLEYYLDSPVSVDKLVTRRLVTAR